MAKPSNQESGSGSTGSPKKPSKKSPKTPPGKGRYDWGSGARHSIPLSQHQDNVRAQQTLGTQDLTASPTAGQAIREANSAADLEYGPQVTAAQQLSNNVAPWFQDYQARVAGYAQAAKAQSDPVVTQAQTFQQNTGTQMAPGLDPNSEAGKAAALAAQGRQALAALGTQALQANQQATGDYFGGLQAVAAKQQPQAQAAAGQQLAQAQSQRGAAVNTFLTGARQNAQNYSIARGTLGLNQQNAQTDALTAGGYDPVTGKKLPPKPPSASDQKTAADLAFFEKHGYYPSTGPPKADKPAGLTPAQKQAQAEKDAKALEGRRTSSNKAASRITDIVSRIPTYSKRKIPTGAVVETKDKDGNVVKTDQAKPATPEQIRNMLLEDGFTADEIKLALKLRSGQKLSSDEIDLAHRMGVTHIPNAWRPKQGKGVAGRPGNAPAGTGNQQRPT